MDSFNNDIVIRFASFLCSKDLVNLASTCRRFGSSRLHDTRSSLMEDTAHQIMCNAKQEEKEALPKLADQSFIELYSELEKYRAPRIFNQLIGRAISDPICYVNNNKSHLKLLGNKKKTNTAICKHVMRAGRHYATFTKEGEGDLRIGIIRPLKNRDKKGLVSFDPMYPGYFPDLIHESTERWGSVTNHNGSSIKVNYCSLMVGTRPGRCFWHDWNIMNTLMKCSQWNGSEGFDNGDEIGMLLDLNVGTLSIYKNGRKLGILKDGLAGEYCWVATMWTHGIGVRIKKGSLPSTS